MKNVKRFLAMALTLCLVIGLLPMSIFAATSTGTTSGEPFLQGTGGSNSFRIPALVTLSDGTLVAAADARWNTTYDGGGLDTIVSVSKDNGDTWSYSFANYLNDNGDSYNGSASTAFIDPALAVTADDTIYMLCDLYPYGVALNGSGNTAPVTTKGFNSDGKLLLSGDNHTSYSYYLDGTVIKDASGNTVSGYVVDGYFNLYQNDTYVSNLFFSDSPYKVVRTGFLYLTKSTDKGATWSEPTLLNLKTSSEMVCLVAPGRGLVTSSGMIVFPVYSYNGSQSTQQMGFIYSTDNGATWKRSASFTGASWSSESAAVELGSGNLRFFYRNGNTVLSYVDYDMTNNTWGSQNTTSISTNSNCQISAITYSKTIGGQQVILVSCPTGPNEAGSDQSGASYRLNGKIFAFTVNSDGVGMTSRGSIAVTSNDAQFMYSCLTELSDGTVGILYEDCESAWGAGSNCYYTMSYAEYDLETALGVTFDAATEPEETTPSEPETDGNVTATDESITVTGDAEVTVVEGLTTFVAYEVTLTKDGASYTGEASVTIKLNGKFADDVELWGFVVNSDGSITYIKDVVRDTEVDTLTFTAPHFSTVGATPALTAEGDTTVTGADTVTSNGGTGTSYVLDTDGLDNGAQYLIVYNSNALTNTKGSLAVTISGNNATPASDASAALWTYTVEESQYFWSSDSYYLSNGDKYLYPSRTWSSGWTYSLNVGNENSLTITNNNDGTYTINCSNAYVAYTSNAWGAQSSAQKLSFYKYTEGTESWTVDAALQEIRIAALNVANDGYTDESWNAYQSALTAAQSKLAEVEAAAYTSETAANTALNELIAAVDALETAKNALVKAVTININYQANGTTVATGTLKVAANATSAALPSTVVGTDGNTYTVDNTTLKLTSGTTSYDVTVTELAGTPISIKENETGEISVALTDGQYVQWSTADSSYVGVAGEYDASAGAYTATAVIVGHNVTTDPVLVTGTVYNSNGSVAGTYKWLVTVTEGDADTNTSSKYIYINVARIQNCTVYYSINGGELVKITDDMLEGPFSDTDGTYYKLKVPMMDEQYTGGFQISFFAQPDDGYSLTYMSSTNSAGEYYILSDGENPDGTDSSAWPFVDNYDWDSFDSLTTKPGGNDTSVFDTTIGTRWGLAEGNLTVAQMKVLFTNARQLGCDGMLVFTKNSTGTTNGSTTNFGNNDLVTELQFVAYKLPEMDKVISSVTHQDGSMEPYTEGMNIVIGDTINYTIHVFVPVTSGNLGKIEYTNIKLVDKLTDESWSSGDATIDSTNTSAITFADGIDSASSFTYTNAAGEDVTYTGDTTVYLYYTSLTLGAGNFLSVVKDGYITNTADLTYTYQGNYSNGAHASVSNAVAEVVVVVPEYVIDFGAPVVIDLTNDPLVKGDVITGAVAKYGTVNITDERTFTYTPTGILQGSDFITLTFKEDQTQAIIGYGVRVYPATTVYYEEGFVNWGAGWTGASKGSGEQTYEPLGGKINNYGYDSLYGNTTGASSGTQATASTIGASGTFTFTGNGIEIYANCTTGTGWLMVEIRDASTNALKKAFMVNTVAGANQYGLPVVTWSTTTHGTYTVTLKKVSDTNPVNIDGVRIHNTIEDSSIFTVDLEDDPVYHEIRDEVLEGLSVKEVIADSEYNYGAILDNKNGFYDVSSLAGYIHSQVYADGTANSGALVLSGDGNVYTNSEQIKELLDNGPKNELFLYAGQSLTFKITTNRVVQIGLKTPQGTINGNITVNGAALYENGVDFNTTVDMFYTISTPKDADSDGTNDTETLTITITNNSGNILSVTDLKICDDPNFSFEALSVEDIEQALNAMGYEDEAEEEEIPEETVPEETEPEETVPEETVPEETEPEETKPAKPSKPGKDDKNDRDFKDDLKEFFESMIRKFKSFFSFKR